jgi:hypothetical protein
MHRDQAGPMLKEELQKDRHLGRDITVTTIKQWNKDRGTRQQLCLRKERLSSRIFRKTAELERTKQMPGLRLDHEE